ncbi:hypothetical protein EDB84DRAFT_1613631, partial [Lactarius hengduanensis]
IRLVTLSLFFWAPLFGIWVLYYRDPCSSRVASLPARLHEETRCAATLKARQGPIKKHSPSKEIDSYSTMGSYDTQYGTSSSRPSSVRTTSSESACSVTAASGYAVWSASRGKKNVSSTRSFGPEIEYAPSMKERAHFFPCALGGRSAHGPDDSPKYYTLDALRQLNEAAEPVFEYDAPDRAAVDRAARVGQLQYAKFDFFRGGRRGIIARSRGSGRSRCVLVETDDQLAFYIP